MTSSLNGLVGGIVAGTFGVPIIVKTSEPGNGKLSMLGALFSNTNKHIYGLLYAISYIVIGVSGIVIWVVLDENTISVISEMSKIFIGMLIAIVITFFSPQKLFYPTK